MDVIQRFCALPPEARAALSTGDLHSGSTFDASVLLTDPDVQAEIQAAFEQHRAYPVFWVLPEPQRQERHVATKGTESGRMTREV